MLGSTRVWAWSKSAVMDTETRAHHLHLLHRHRAFPATVTSQPFAGSQMMLFLDFFLLKKASGMDVSSTSPSSAGLLPNVGVKTPLGMEESSDDCVEHMVGEEVMLSAAIAREGSEKR
jgi:hypothetical protein